jgi:hypothetical protein
LLTGLLHSSEVSSLSGEMSDYPIFAALEVSSFE